MCVPWPEVDLQPEALPIAPLALLLPLEPLVDFARTSAHVTVGLGLGVAVWMGARRAGGSEAQ